MLNRLPKPLIVVCILLVTQSITSAEKLDIVVDIDRQPLVAATERLIEAMAFSGAPLDEQTVSKIRRAGKLESEVDAVRGIQEILDPLCIAEVHINAESRVKVCRRRWQQSADAERVANDADQSAQ